MNLLDLAYMTAAGLTAPWWMRKSRSGWPERWARAVPDLPVPTGRPRIMLHAVSVGEVNACRAIVPMLASEAEVVLTVTTDTGITRARDLLGGHCTVCRFPLDASWAVRRFLDAVRPDAIGLVELELWPNFVRECARRAIPVGVVNGRLSERSFRGYRRVTRWIAPAFRALEFAAVQEEAYAERFVAMGVAPDRCLITGSMKFDSAEITDTVEGAEALADELGIDRSRPLVVAGSTGPGEEQLLFEARASMPDRGVQLLCAPRKPERFGQAAAALPGCVRRSSGMRGSDAGLFLLDTIGELRQAYSLADVVVVGRSFFDQHGSDPIEPAALGKPVVIGPAVADFTSIVEALQAAGGLVRATGDSLPGVLLELLEAPDRGRRIGQSGREAVRAMQGASERHRELLLLAASKGRRSRPGVRGTSGRLGSSAARA